MRPGPSTVRAVFMTGLAIALLTACVASPQLPLNDGTAQSELRVVTSGGFTAAYNVLAPAFERETGVRLVTEYGASSGGAPDSIPVRLARGERFDVIILSQSSLNALTREGYVRADSRRDLVRSSIGMAIRDGAAAPDISTPERFRQVLLDATSIGYSASASGTYLSTDLFPRLGLWERISAKATRVVSERVATVVARGDVEIGFQQISEILPIEGAQFVGPIPDNYQKVTTFSAGITARADNPSDAERLIRFVSSAAVADTVAATGLEPVVNEQ